MSESIQALADSRLAEPYKQPVKTLDECLEELGWQLNDEDRPVCCGNVLKVTAFIGMPYQCICPDCQKFLFNVFGPEFGNSWVQTIDTDKFDTEDPKQWVCGTRKEAQ